MGVKTPLSPAQLQEFFPCTLLIPTADGVSDTVYRCDQGVLKLFETASEGAVREEAALLGTLRPLPVPELLMEPFTLHGKPCALYAALHDFRAVGLAAALLALASAALLHRSVREGGGGA